MDSVNLRGFMIIVLLYRRLLYALFDRNQLRCTVLVIDFALLIVLAWVMGIAWAERVIIVLPMTPSSLPLRYNYVTVWVWIWTRQATFSSYSLITL